MLTVKDCLVLVATLAVTVSCQDQRLEIVPLFEGLTSTPGNQFTFQPQPAVPGLQRETELTSPRPSLNLQAFKAVPIAAPPTATIPPAVPHPSLKEKLPTTPTTTSPPPPSPPSPPTAPPTTTTTSPPTTTTAAPPSPPTAPPTTTTTTPPPPPPPTTTDATPAKTLSVFGSSLPAGRPQSLAELPRQRPQQQQPELFQQQQQRQQQRQQQQQQQQRQQQQLQPSRFQTQFDQNPRQQFAPQPPPQRVVQQPRGPAGHPEEFLNRLTEEDKTKFLQQFSYLNLEQQQYAYNQFLSTPANVQQFAINQFLSLDPEVLVFSIQTEIDSEKGVQPQQQQNPQPIQPQFTQQQQQQQGQRFNNNNQQPRQLTRSDARALQQQENALNDIIALQNSLNFPNQS